MSKERVFFPLSDKGNLINKNEVNEITKNHNSDVDFCVSKSENITKLYNNRLNNGDLDLVCYDNSKSRVHKFVLAANSSLMMKKFFTEKNGDNLGSISSSSNNVNAKSFNHRRNNSYEKLSDDQDNIEPNSNNCNKEGKIIDTSSIVKDFIQESVEVLIKFCYRAPIDFRILEKNIINDVAKIAKTLQVEELVKVLKSFTSEPNNETIREEKVNLSKGSEEIYSSKTDEGYESLKEKINTENYSENGSLISHPIGDKSGIVIKLADLKEINMIKMKLFDKFARSYSYIVEISRDNENWEKIYDYSENYCRSWQLLYFDDRFVKYVKILGIECFDTMRWDYFEVYSIELSRVEIKLEYCKGILCPKEDMAKVEKGAILLSGKNRFILKSDNENFKNELVPKFSYHAINGSIIVQMSQIMQVETIRMKISQATGFRILISKDSKIWTEIHKYEHRDSHILDHLIKFDKQPLTFIKIIGHVLNDNDIFKVTCFQCPASSILN